MFWLHEWVSSLDKLLDGLVSVLFPLEIELVFNFKSDCKSSLVLVLKVD